MVDSTSFCSDRSKQAGERLAGSAPAGVRYWLLVEDHGPWGPKEPNALSLLDPNTKERWTDLGKRAGVRRLYLRRPKHPATMPQAPRRFWIAENSAQGSSVVELPAQSLPAFVEQVESVGLSDMIDSARAAPPMWLVCTHGRRDRCCSLHGMGLFQSLREHSDHEVWQCSHLGGHRFAATALHLPSGYVWGRLSQSDGAALGALREGGELVLPEGLRGHSGLSTPAQLADLLLRESKGDWSARCNPSLWEIPKQARRVEIPGERAMTLHEGPNLQILGSCADAAPKSRAQLQARWAESS